MAPLVMLAHELCQGQPSELKSTDRYAQDDDDDDDNETDMHKTALQMHQQARVCSNQT
jgi:hypothetical protein